MKQIVNCCAFRAGGHRTGGRGRDRAGWGGGGGGGWRFLEGLGLKNDVQSPDVFLRVTVHTCLLSSTVHTCLLKSTVHTCLPSSTVHTCLLKSTVHICLLSSTVHTYLLSSTVHTCLLSSTVHTYLLSSTVHTCLLKSTVNNGICALINGPHLSIHISLLCVNSPDVLNQVEGSNLSTRVVIPGLLPQDSTSLLPSSATNVQHRSTFGLIITTTTTIIIIKSAVFSTVTYLTSKGETLRLKRSEHIRYWLWTVSNL